jgi:hypothetical protein
MHSAFSEVEFPPQHPRRLVANTSIFLKLRRRRQLYTKRDEYRLSPARMADLRRSGLETFLGCGIAASRLS